MMMMMMMMSILQKSVTAYYTTAYEYMGVDKWKDYLLKSQLETKTVECPLHFMF
jgi:nitrogen regulatory protein PII-like uncharacterized protein